MKSTWELFWDFINERHMIYVKRFVRHLPKPWTDDPIFQQYKFTNVFRQLDRTTQWLTDHISGPHAHESGWLVFNIAMFRLFGSIESGESHGWVKDWRPERMIKADLARLARKEKVFTGAYVITNAGQSRPKVEVVIKDFLTPIWKNKGSIYMQARNTRSLELTWSYLHNNFPGLGGNGFMAYEIVTDLRHTPILKDATDIMTWANAGPGAIRGLNRIHGRFVRGRETVHIKKKEALGEMCELLEMSLAGGVLKDHVPSLEMRDIEHSLCEFDKYMRVKNGEGKPRSRYPGV